MAYHYQSATRALFPPLEVITYRMCIASRKCYRPRMRGSQLRPACDEAFNRPLTSQCTSEWRTLGMVSKRAQCLDSRDKPVSVACATPVPRFCCER